MALTIAYSVGSFILILVALVLLRLKNSRFEVKPSDIVVSVLPVLVFLLVTGRLQKFEIGESGLKIETAFVAASSSAIAPQVTPLTGLPTQQIEVDPKGGVGDIPRLLELKTEALSFRLGRGGYYVGPAIEQYLVQLSKGPYLKFVIIENADGSFFGSADARDLAALFQAPRSDYSAGDVAQWLNTDDTKALARLPGFVGAQTALTSRADKAEALTRMETANVDTLPVVDERNRYIGIVNRSRLTASLLIDVSSSLAAGGSRDAEARNTGASAPPD